MQYKIQSAGAKSLIENFYQKLEAAHSRASGMINIDLIGNTKCHQAHQAKYARSVRVCAEDEERRVFS